MADDTRSDAPTQGRSDLPAALLDDHTDRDELRQRYYGLLQELRVLLPGVQVLLAFLLTVPFASRFGRLDDVERVEFAVALWSALAATICFVAPTSFHRVARRTARSARLVWAIRMLSLGLAFLAVALLAAVACVTRFVFGGVAATAATAGAAVAIVTLWVVLPLADGGDPSPTDRPRP